jgi:hypothetical protein
MSKSATRYLTIALLALALGFIYFHLQTRHVDHVQFDVAGVQHRLPDGMNYADCGAEAASTPAPLASAEHNSQLAVLQSLLAASNQPAHSVRLNACSDWRKSAMLYALLAIVVGVGAIVVNERRA